MSKLIIKVLLLPPCLCLTFFLNVRSLKIRPTSGDMLVVWHNLYFSLNRCPKEAKIQYMRMFSFADIQRPGTIRL